MRGKKWFNVVAIVKKFTFSQWSATFLIVNLKNSNDLCSFFSNSKWQRLSILKVASQFKSKPFVKQYSWLYTIQYIFFFLSLFSIKDFYTISKIYYSKSLFLKFIFSDLCAILFIYIIGPFLQKWKPLIWINDDLFRHEKHNWHLEFALCSLYLNSYKILLIFVLFSFFLCYFCGFIPFIATHTLQD